MTPSKYIELVYKRQSHWIGVASFYGSKTPEDDVQDAYIKAFEYVQRNGVREDVDPFGLMFFCVRSASLSSKNKLDKSLIHNISDGVIEIMDDSEYNKEQEDEIVTLIFDEVDSWEWFEKTLFTLYFNLLRSTDKQLSMRKLAKETKIALPTIFTTIKDCKIKIKNRIYEEFRIK